MRAVFVNYIHPATPHVSGTRVSQFADALARAGHQIVLLTSSLNGDEENKPLHVVSEEIQQQNWNRPYHLACSPQFNKNLKALRDGRLPSWKRKVIILWYYLRHSGVFHDWVIGTRAYWELLIKVFKPEVTWGTFGNTDTWVVAQGIARLVGVSWVMDVKDGWDPFIPVPLRGLLARRFYNAAAMTTNSQYQADLSQRWFPHKPVVIYSGVPSFLLGKEPSVRVQDSFRITLVGSIYNEQSLNSFIEGVRLWLSKSDPALRSRVVLSYAGGEEEMIRRAGQILQDLCSLEVHGYLSLERLFELCSGSSVNVYLWSHKVFHHKLIELLCCQRPIIAFPGERPEAFELARQAKVDFFVCQSPEELSRVLGELMEDLQKNALNCDMATLARFSWDAKADRLIEVMEGTVEGGPKE